MPSDSDTFLLGGDLDVGRLGFGAMRITGDGIWGAPADPAGCRELLRRVVQDGVTLIDTADSYGPEVSEDLIAEALWPYPENLVIATKGGLERPGPNVWERNCRPDRLRRCCESSLKRLKLERIDLYQLHAVDPKVPIEDSIGALAELQDEGKVRHIGVSNVSLEDLERAQQIVPIVSVQNRYNVVDRASEDVLRGVRAPAARVPPLGTDRQRERRRPPRSCRRRDRPRPRRHASPGGARLAARPFAGDPADPRHELDPALRGEPRGRAARTRGRRA